MQAISKEQAHSFNEQNRPTSVVVPSVVDATRGGERAWDIYSSLMKKSHIIWLTSEVNDQNCELLKAELMYLDAEPIKDESGNIQPIIIYIDSPGGGVTSGLSVVDIMQQIKTPVATVVAGMAASMGSVISAAGAPGLRIALPNAQIMVHQPSSGSRGKETEMRIGYHGILDCRNRLETLYALWMGLDTENRDDLNLVSELLEHDTYLNAFMAQKLGLIDTIQAPDPEGMTPAKKAFHKLTMEQNQFEYDQISRTETFEKLLMDVVSDYGDDKRMGMLKEAFEQIRRGSDNKDLQKLKSIVVRIAEKRDQYLAEARAGTRDNPYLVLPAPANQP